MSLVLQYRQYFEFVGKLLCAIALGFYFYSLPRISQLEYLDRKRVLVFVLECSYNLDLIAVSPDSEITAILVAGGLIFISCLAPSGKRVRK